MYRTLAALGVILVALATAALGALYGFTLLLTIDDYDEAEREYERLQCLGDIILSEVPTDAVVYVAEWGSSGNEDPVQRMYWLQRITELTYPERAISGDTARADVIVRLVKYDDGPCDGFGIDVTQT